MTDRGLQGRRHARAERGGSRRVSATSKSREQIVCISQEHPHQMLGMLRKWPRITSKNRSKRSARRGTDKPRSVTGQWRGWSGSDATHRVALALMRLSGPLAMVSGISEVHGMRTDHVLLEGHEEDSSIAPDRPQATPLWPVSSSGTESYARHLSV